MDRYEREAEARHAERWQQHVNEGLKRYNESYADADRRKSQDVAVSALVSGIRSAMMAAPDLLGHLKPYDVAEYIMRTWPTPS